MRREPEKPTRRKAAKGKSEMPLVRSVERVAHIMETLFLTPEGKTLSDLSRDLDLHKTTALRLLRTLVAVKVVEKDPSGGLYRWKPVPWMNVAFRMRQFTSRVEAVQGLLDELAAATGETVGLGFPDIDQRSMICAAASLSDQPVRVHITPHLATPMHACAVGRSYLASLSDEELREWARNELPRLTESTTVCPERLVEEILQVREKGHALTHSESLLGASGLAVQVVDATGTVVAALGITAPTERTSEENVERWLPILRRGAQDISLRLHAFADLPRLERVGEAPRLPKRGKRTYVPLDETVLRKSYRVV